MPLIDVRGTECVLNAAGAAVPANMTGTTAEFKRAMRAIVIAAPVPLIGHAASTGARSGFMIDFAIPYAGAAAFLNGLLNPTGITIGLQFGLAGGVQLTNCIAETLSVDGAEGGDITGKANFQSTSIPSFGFTGIAGSFTDIWKFTDVTSFTGATGIPRLDVSRFSFQIKRTLSRYTGNSPTGIAKRLGKAYDEAQLDVTMLHGSDDDAIDSVSACPILAPMNVLLTQACGGSSTLTFSIVEGFYDQMPTTSGPTIGYIDDAVIAMANTGLYSIL